MSGPVVSSQQFALPKELVLAVLALASAVLLLSRDDTVWFPSIDGPLAIVMSWGGVLILVRATNTAVAWQALGTFTAGTLVFLLAREVGSKTSIDLPLLALCVVMACFAVVMLLEALGAIPFISEPGRRPGATVGNRNLAARLLCLTLPLLWRQAFHTVRRSRRLAFGSLTAVMIAAIVLSRSRGAWLAAAVLVSTLPAVTFWTSDRNTRGTLRWTMVSWFGGVFIGALVAVVVPNHLNWGPDDFASSAQRILQHQTGTGRGRLIQASTTWRLIRAAPLMGVGPGNWAIIYPAYATSDDPSVRWSAFYPAPQEPRNEILSFAAEFGIPGLIVALSGLLGLSTRAIGMLRSNDAFTQQRGLAVLASVLGATLLGIFDSVVRPPPTLALLAIIVGLAFGAGSVTEGTRPARRRGLVARKAVIVGYASTSLLLANYAIRDIAAFGIIRTLSNLRELYQAVAIAPSNMEARMLLAYGLAGVGRCDLAERQLVHAAQLQPYSRAPTNLRVRCGARPIGP
jgi:O-antigen ligase